MRYRCPSQKKRPQAGFTLIELLIAAFVLVVGVMAMSGLVGLTVKNNGHNRLDSTATMLNQAVVEQLTAGLNYQSFGGTGLANLYDCGTHTIAANNPWSIDSSIGGAPIINGNIDFSQPQVAGYFMNYVVCVGTTQVVYDVRWNISGLSATDTTTFTHILTVGSRMQGGPSIINFPINMRVMVGPDPAPGT
jgi:prepilin-type N-terminal cleavage/methylation domain-containing protein